MHSEQPKGISRGFTTACCGDHRLNRFVSAFDGNSSYRRRDLGAPSDFIIDLSALLVWHQKLIGFPPDKKPIFDAVILVHTDCLAIQTNVFFRTLKRKRSRYAMTHKGDIEFCAKQLEIIQLQTDRLSGPTSIHWHFGIIDTDLAEKLSNNATRQDALSCMQWLSEIPEFLTKGGTPSRIVLAEQHSQSPHSGRHNRHPPTNTHRPGDSRILLLQ